MGFVTERLEVSQVYEESSGAGWSRKQASGGHWTGSQEASTRLWRIPSLFLHFFVSYILIFFSLCLHLPNAICGLEHCLCPFLLCWLFVKEVDRFTCFGVLDSSHEFMVHHSVEVFVRYIFKLINLFYFILSFLAVLGLRCCAWAFLWLWRAGATLRCGVQASHCGGFSCCGAQALGVRASVVVAHGLSSCGSRALELRLSSCGAQA